MSTAHHTSGGPAQCHLSPPTLSGHLHCKLSTEEKPSELCIAYFFTVLIVLLFSARDNMNSNCDDMNLVSANYSSDAMM